MSEIESKSCYHAGKIKGVKIKEKRSMRASWAPCIHIFSLPSPLQSGQVLRHQPTAQPVSGPGHQEYADNLVDTKTQHNNAIPGKSLDSTNPVDAAWSEQTILINLVFILCGVNAVFLGPVCVYI